MRVKRDLKSPFSIELYFSLSLLIMVHSLCLYEDMLRNLLIFSLSPPSLIFRIDGGYTWKNFDGIARTLKLKTLSR